MLNIYINVELAFSNFKQYIFYLVIIMNTQHLGTLVHMTWTPEKTYCDLISSVSNFVLDSKTWIFFFFLSLKTSSTKVKIFTKVKNVYCLL